MSNNWRLDILLQYNISLSFDDYLDAHDYDCDKDFQT